MYELISSFKALSFKGFCPISNDKTALSKLSFLNMCRTRSVSAP